MRLLLELAALASHLREPPKLPHKACPRGALRAGQMMQDKATSLNLERYQMERLSAMPGSTRAAQSGCSCRVNLLWSTVSNGCGTNEDPPPAKPMRGSVRDFFLRDFDLQPLKVERYVRARFSGFTMASHGSGANWFLAQLKPNSAWIAERNLKLQRFTTFLPLEERTEKRGGRFVTRARPLFPGYIFVSFDPARGLWRKINSTPGVSRLVSFGREPAPVPSELVSQLMLRCDEQGKLMPPERLKPGVQVAITKGPFANFVAEIEKCTPDRRVWVLVEIMGRRSRIAVGADHVRAV